MKALAFLIVFLLCFLSCSVGNGSGDTSETKDGGLVIYEDSGNGAEDDGEENDKDKDASNEEDVKQDDKEELKVSLKREPPTACIREEGGPTDTDIYLCRMKDEKIGPEDNCRTNEDCGENERGFCYQFYEWDGSFSFCKCLYDECLTDEDCPEGKACTCAGSGNIDGVHFDQFINHRCVEANCRTNADCPEDEYCMVSLRHVKNEELRDFLRIEGFYCSTPHDTCRSNEICKQSHSVPAFHYLFCTYNPKDEGGRLNRPVVASESEHPHWGCALSPYNEGG